MGENIISKYGDYERTNLSFEEVFSGEYDLPINFEPETVLDIGANEGAFTAWALKRWSKTNVLAFEPIPENAAIFSKNHGSNPRVGFHKFAVSDFAKVKLFRGKNNSGECSMFNYGEQDMDNSVESYGIPANTIPSCEFVKIDTEGCEVDIITGLDLSKTKCLVCEYHSASDCDKIKAIMGNKGFLVADHLLHSMNVGVLKFWLPNCAVKKPSLFLAMPCYRTMDALTAQCLIRLVAEQMTHNEFSLKIRMHVGECPIGRARNDLTHDFLDTDCTHILFIDSDIIFSYEQVKKILLAKEEIIGGFYVKKQEGAVSPVCNTLNEVDKPREDGLVRVKYMGTGFLRIKREVLEKMILDKPELAYTDDRDGKTIKHDFWRMGVDTDCVTGVKRWLSEDWQFCQFAIQCGYDIWADASILVQHAGVAVFPLSYQVNELYTKEQQKRMGITPFEAPKDLSDSAPQPTSRLASLEVQSV